VIGKILIFLKIKNIYFFFLDWKWKTQVISSDIIEKTINDGQNLKSLNI